MTDNSDFIERYVGSGDDGRPERLGTPPVDDKLPDGRGGEGTRSNAFRTMDPHLRGFSSSTSAKGGDTPVGHSAIDQGLHAQLDGSPPATGGGVPPNIVGGAPVAPSGQPRNPNVGQPPPPTLKPRSDEGGVPPLHHESPPLVDPAERWAPQAHRRTADSVTGQHIQLRDVAKQRREPAEMGWRKVIYLSTGHMLNLGAGPAERRFIAWRDRISSNIPGNYQIAAISVKGGVGKTRVTAGVGSVFAELRKQPVLAIDANPTYGGLGRLIDPRIQTSVRDFLAAEDLVDYPRARFYTGQNKQGLEVLAGNQNVANPMALGARTFTDTVSRARRFYQLALVDCGAEIEHPVVPAVLSASDSLLIVGSCSVEGGLAIETTIDWLEARNGQELLKRSVIVLNDAYHSADENLINYVRETLSRRVHAVKTIPWDIHLRDAVTLDFPALKRSTRLAFMELAAELAGGFATAGALAG